MRLSYLPGIALAALLMASCSPSQEANYRVIPLPASIEQTSTGSDHFTLSGSTVIAVPAGNEGLMGDAGHLATYIEQLTGHQLKIVTDAPSSNAIVLADNLESDNPEAYTLTVTNDLITINGASDAGTFYGIQTLRKSIPEAKKGDVKFPAVVIADAPRFSYRGAHLDVSRHFFPTDSIKNFIDMLALHNINRFHWHITDDQGWRIEIKSRPELTELGSKRAGTVIGHNTGEYDGIPVEGYYTQAEIRDIIDYAAQRHIVIIPEIDLPGHMLGALKAYPYLGCTGGPYEVWQQWGVSDDVLCAGNDSTYKFIDDVLGEVVALFPSEYIHVGGDECPKTRWAACPKCQAKIAKLGLRADSHGTKEEKLQSYVIHHASDFLTSKGRKMIGWDETLEGGLAPGAVVMSWRGEAGGIEAARQKHDVIMTPNNYLYFDYYQTLDREKEPDAIGGYVPVEKVYSYEPLSKELTPEEAQYIIGVQANLWTEYIPTYSQVQYMELPRMAALAEVQWNQNTEKDYPEFASRLPQLINQYDLQGYNYATHVFNVNGSLTPNPETNAIEAVLTTVDNAPIYYTLDGSEPTASSALYTEPITLDKSATIKAIALREGGRPSTVYVDSVSFNKATSHPIELRNQPPSRYSADGPQTLVDGKFGPNGYSNGSWVGFYGNGLDAVIDLQQPTQVEEVTIRACVATGDWVFDARSLKVETSMDGQTYTQVACEEYPAMKMSSDNIVTHAVKFSPVEARYVRVIADAESKIPDWHPGAGRAGFLFIDEIEIN
ncbi:MAG: glycoside hydrolase family 20 protein [Bacteroidales bacterium]|nr:glycoside hydrolase family 20 protein [Bacteroidales bacterium]